MTIHLSDKQKLAEYTMLVQPYVEKKYSGSMIPCQFDLHRVNADGSTTKQEKTCFLHSDEYIQLLALMLMYPDITFQDLPIYIAKDLYEQLLVHLRFPRYAHICNLSLNPKRSAPIAVEMITFQQDAREIAGEDRYSFVLPIKDTDRFSEVAIYIDCRKIKVQAVLVLENRALHYLVYRDIDALAVQSMLGASDYKELEKKILAVYETLSLAKQDDSLWFIKLLDESGITYKCYERVIDEYAF